MRIAVTLVLPILLMPGLIGRMFREWGVDRLMWGSDALTDRHPSSLTQARQVWPLSEAEWGTLAGFDGAGFLPRPGT